MGDVGEVPALPRVGNAMGNGEGRESNELRTAMDAMDVGEEVMAEGGVKEADKEGVEAERGGLGGYLLELEAMGFLTQDAEPGGTTLFDAQIASMI